MTTLAITSPSPRHSLNNEANHVLNVRKCIHELVLRYGGYHLLKTLQEPARVWSLFLTLPDSWNQVASLSDHEGKPSSPLGDIDHVPGGGGEGSRCRFLFETLQLPTRARSLHRVHA
jgi:hypothetical protein